jgi:hypothetical protein
MTDIFEAYYDATGVYLEDFGGDQTVRADYDCFRRVHFYLQTKQETTISSTFTSASVSRQPSTSDLGGIPSRRGSLSRMDLKINLGELSRPNSTQLINNDGEIIPDKSVVPVGSALKVAKSKNNANALKSNETQ